MARPRTGSITFDEKRNVFVVRLTYHDEAGKRHDLRRTTETKTEGLRLLAQLQRDLDDGGAQSIDGDRLTFKKLAEIFEDRRLVEPVYRDGQKVAGLRSWRDQRWRLKRLTEYFGARRVKSVTFADLESYKKHRLDGKKKKGGDRSITTINRELALLRSVFKFAKQCGWISRSPFEQGAGIISTAVETRRERILTREEEARLLLACECRERHHIRPIIIAGLDTAGRRGELLGLTWGDVNFAAGLITLTSYKGKKMTKRTIGMTTRLKAELERIHEAAPKDPDAKVFGIESNFYKAFDTACEKAGIQGFRFHDCRHTAITRMVQSGMPHLEIMKLSGHTTFATFERYVNSTVETARRGAEVLDSLNRQIIEETASDFVN